jgi:cytochrome oxidase assembly protein ShyY1
MRSITSAEGSVIAVGACFNSKLLDYSEIRAPDNLLRSAKRQIQISDNPGKLPARSNGTIPANNHLEYVLTFFVTQLLHVLDE